MRELFIYSGRLVLGIFALAPVPTLAPAPARAIESGALTCPADFKAKIAQAKNTELLDCVVVANIMPDAGKSQAVVVQNIKRNGAREDGEGGITVSVYPGNGPSFETTPAYRESGLGFRLLPFTRNGKKTDFAVMTIAGAARPAWVIRTVSQPTSLIYVKAFDASKNKFESWVGKEFVVSDFADDVVISPDAVEVMHGKNEKKRILFIPAHPGK